MLKPGVLLVVPELASFTAFFEGVARECLDSGYRVGLVVGGSGAQAEVDDRRIDVYPMPSCRGGSPGSLVLAAGALRRAVASFSPAVVHANFLAGCLVAALSRGVCGSSGAAWIGTLHGLYSPTAKGLAAGGVAACELWAARRMDEAWVLTSGDEDYLRRAGLGSRVKRYRSCGVGCDLQIFDRSRFSEESVRAIRHRLGMAAEDFVIVYVGRAVAFKGYPEVIRAFWRMAARDAAVRLLIVGAGDAVHRTGLSPRETQRVEGDSRIVRAGWTSDVASLLAAADVFALPSRREGLSVAIMEALACGVPVVTSAARGCGELVRGGIDGVILDDVSAESLDQALTALRNDRALRCRMGADARAGRSRFSRRAYEVEQVSIYRRLTDIQESASARGSSP